ncbi:PepSY domain-containing protein [Prolixibacteraceae bacterium JC049]|nr:PepSY domain-containing protein [Prolixibacteraceae bacterium JC049]
MEKKRGVKSWRRLHKWPGIILSVFILLFSISGIIMNHRSWFSSVDINRSYLPSHYTYNNWNLAAIKSSVAIDKNAILVYGNVGIWKTDTLLSTLHDYNQGFPRGIDHRKVESMIIDQNKTEWAGTLFGLYKRENDNELWQKVELPVEEERIVDLRIHREKLLVLTRSHILVQSENDKFKTIRLKATSSNSKVSLFKTLWMLHSGELWGTAGKLLVDFMGIVFIILSITGLLHFIFPKLIRFKKKKGQTVSQLASTFKSNLKWHNRLGWTLLPFLIIVTITGMFLRPPLLIPIASTKVEKIPFTELDTPNPWYDQLRRIIWDKKEQKFLLSTNNGFYYCDENFSQPPAKIDFQPPVSIMGCTVLEPIQPGVFMIGSFNGLFAWDIKNRIVFDYLKRAIWKPTRRVGPPISENMISGMIFLPNKKHVVFDYSRGAFDPAQKVQIGHMPTNVVQNSPMSLWNFALETHTGRIFEHLLGKFYILYVPLIGLLTLMLLISGFIIWNRRHRS